MEPAAAGCTLESLLNAQIAERCGWSEPTNFTAAFKKHLAVLPRDLREGKDS